MVEEQVVDAFRRLGGGAQPDIASALTAIAATAKVGRAALDAATAGSDAAGLLDALVVLRWVQGELAGMEPVLIEAARAAGASWQELAPALGVASRQAAERRYLRLVPAKADQDGSTRDGRVRAERDRRAGRRAIARWANENVADLRRLAGQVTALTDLGTAADADVGRLHDALADPDASALPGLLAETHRHLGAHPDLADRIDTVTSQTDRVRQQTQERRDQRSGSSG